jgi:1-acyl-sn-glycerol-3-phosphate acyltransferase
VVAFYIFRWCRSICCSFIVACRRVACTKVTGDEHIPPLARRVLTCNHVSFVDPVLLDGRQPPADLLL